MATCSFASASLLFLALALQTISSSTTANGSGASKKPNFVVFFVDDMGYGDLSFTGHPTIYTPNIDKLANEGMFLTQFYSGFHICSPSRASMLTGRLPPRTGCAGQWKGDVFWHGAIAGFPSYEVTFAEALRDVGYSTIAIGKWHLGERPQFLPTSHGFDEFLGLPYSVDMGVSPYSSRPWTDPVLALIGNMTVLEQPVDLSQLTGKYTAKAIDFIEKNSAMDKPFVLYLPYSHVHTPDFTSKQFCNSSRRGRFGDSLNEVDNSIGQIMNALQSNGVSDNTLTFFTSDNGPWLIEKLAGGSSGLFRSGKSTTWEGGIRMPAIAHWPGQIQPHSRSAELTATYDIFTTMLTLAGAPIPSDRIIDGEDMSDILFQRNGAKSKHECLYIYGGTPGAGSRDNVACNNDTKLCPGLWALRCGAYKMHWVTRDSNYSDPLFPDPPLLFNVEWDPSELHPIYPNNVQYNGLRRYFEEKKAEHEETYVAVPNYILMGWSPEYDTCGCPDSYKLYPQYPNCTCDPSNWNQFICSPTCLANDNCGPGGPAN